MTFKKTSMALITSALLATTLSARDQIKIVGSSTVYPFSSSVAEEFGATTKSPTPVVESTGTGGGMKLFCAGAGIDTPDITNVNDFSILSCVKYFFYFFITKKPFFIGFYYELIICLYCKWCWII